MGTAQPMDAITLLRNDHKTVEALFKRFEKAGDHAFVEKRAIVDRIVEELSIHASIEEQVFYPSTRSMVPSTEDIALESLEEHHIVKWVLSELDGLDARNERFDAKVTVLIENVRHHVKEEQDDYFPMVRNALSRTQLAHIGQALEQAKQAAPTHPHPTAPDTPTANVVTTIAGVVDRLADNINGIAQGGVAAGQDLVGKIIGKKKPVASPTGSTVARTSAASTRATIDSAVRGVEHTAQSVKKGTTMVAATAKSGAKATATTARKSVGNTATTAKRATTTTSRAARTAVKAVGTTAKSATSETVAAARR